MNTVHVVVSEIRKDTHMIKLYYVASCKEDKVDELKNTEKIEFHGVYETEADATKFMKTCTLNNCKDYTKMLHESGLPDKSRLVQSHSRYLLAYLDDDLTTVPNIYRIPIYEFMTLKEHYPTVRLANDDEIDQTDTDNSVIPMTRETQGAIAKLQLIKLQVSLSSEPEVIQDAEKAYDELYFNTMKLMAGMQNGQSEDIDKLMQVMYPDQDAEFLEEVKSGLTHMIQYVKTAREEGMTDQEIEKVLFAGLSNLVYCAEDELPH